MDSTCLLLSSSRAFRAFPSASSFERVVAAPSYPNGARHCKDCRVTKLPSSGVCRSGSAIRVELLSDHQIPVSIKIGRETNFETYWERFLQKPADEF